MNKLQKRQTIRESVWKTIKAELEEVKGVTHVRSKIKHGWQYLSETSSGNEWRIDPSLLSFINIPRPLSSFYNDMQNMRMTLCNSHTRKNI